MPRPARARNNGGNGAGGLEAPVVGRAEAVRAEAAHAAEGSLEGVAGAIRGTESLLDTLDERLDEPGREVLHAASALLTRSARLDAALSRPIHGAILTVLALDTAWGDAALEVAYNSTGGVADCWSR